MKRENIRHEGKTALYRWVKERGGIALGSELAELQPPQCGRKLAVGNKHHGMATEGSEAAELKAKTMQIM